MFGRKYTVYLDGQSYEIKAANIEKCVNKFGKLLGWKGAYIHSAYGCNFVISQILPRHLREKEIPWNEYITIHDAEGAAWK